MRIAGKPEGSRVCGARRLLPAVAGLALLAPTPSAEAGAWTLEAGRGLAILTMERSKATRRFDRDRQPAEAPAFARDEARLLLEYGLSDRLTLRAKPVAARLVETGRPEGTPRGAASGELGARLRLFEHEGFVGSVEASLRVADAFDTTRTEAEARLLGGYGFQLAGLPAFVDVQLGYLHRPDEESDDLLLDVSAGIRPFERTQLILQAFSAVAGRFGEEGLPLHDRHKIQASVVQDLTARWSVQLGAGATIAGSNAPVERFLVGALWLRF